MDRAAGMPLGSPSRLPATSLRAAGVEVRTEYSDSLSLHDGGLAAFDRSGRLTLLWLEVG
jgi:hypothetical protein